MLGGTRGRCHQGPGSLSTPQVLGGCLGSPHLPAARPAPQPARQPVKGMNQSGPTRNCVSQTVAARVQALPAHWHVRLPEVGRDGSVGSGSFGVLFPWLTWALLPTERSRGLPVVPLTSQSRGLWVQPCVFLGSDGRDLLGEEAPLRADAARSPATLGLQGALLLRVQRPGLPSERRGTHSPDLQPLPVSGGLSPTPENCVLYTCRPEQRRAQRAGRSPGSPQGQWNDLLFGVNLGTDRVNARTPPGTGPGAH